jgi:bifunctional non-homologous end joining protein LigD
MQATYRREPSRRVRVQHDPMAITLNHKDLALLSPGKPFSAPGWIFELKYDGFRVLTLKEGERVRLLSRQGRDMSEAFPELVADLAAVDTDFAIDGELVVLDEAGRPQFERVSSRALMRDAMNIRVSSRAIPAAIMAFDLLHAHGEDHRGLPLVVRKAALKRLLRGPVRTCCAEHVEVHGKEMYDQVCEMELEGIVAKRAASVYRAGRTKDWLKINTLAGRAAEARRMEHRR